MIESSFNRRASQIVLVVSICFFSTALVVINIISDQENWIIPLFLFAIVSCIIIHLVEKPSESNRVYIYAGILAGELFYYCVHVHLLYNAIPVIILVSALFILRQEEKLVILCMLIGLAGMIYNILAKNSQGLLELDSLSIASLIWHFMLLVAAGVLFHIILGVMESNEERYRGRNVAIIKENEQTEVLLAKAAQEFLASALALRTQTELIINKSSNDELRRDMESLVLTLGILENHIEEIYDYSQIKRNQLTVSVDYASLASMVMELKRELIPYQKPQVVLEIHTDPSIPQQLNTDIVKVKKILRHLVVNALERTEDGGIYVSISQDVKPYGMNLSLVVEDTGTGFDEDEKNRLERRFAKEEPATWDSEGLGLDISIVSGLTHAMGGFMSVESTPQSGTKMRVSIPLYASEKFILTRNAIDTLPQDIKKLPDSIELGDILEDVSDIEEIESEIVSKAALEDAASEETNETDAPEKCIDTEKGKLYCADDEELYHKQLIRFAAEKKSRLQEADRYIMSGDTEGYRILVHSIKGISRMIGAAALAQAAKELEDAAKVNDLDYIKDNNRRLRAEYERVVSEIDSMELEIGNISEEADSDIGFLFMPYEKTAKNI